MQLDLHLRVQDGPLLAGTRLAAAYVDLARGRLHLASTGWCHAAVAVHDSAGHLQVSSPDLVPVYPCISAHFKSAAICL